MKGTPVILVAVIVALTLWPSVSSSQAIDPQSLIGEWQGTWETRSGEARGGGQYYLTIEKVEGGKVYGKVTVTGRRSNDFKFVGALEGNRLTYGSTTRTELEIRDDQMKGTSTGGANRAITLSKKK